MQHNLSTFHRRQRHAWISIIFLCALLVSACGPLGDDDDPTATSETIAEPTISTDGSDEASPTSEPSAFIPDSSTPAASVATPDVPVSGEDAGTPSGADQELAVDGTPVSPPSDQDDGAPVASPGPGQSPDSTDAALSGSDGTSGATPDPDILEPPTGTEGTPGSDEPFFVEETPTPTPATPASATAQAGELAGFEPFVVPGCDPESVPPIDSDQVEYETVIDVNFRVGPGEDCDTIGEGPIAANVAVTVLSGPVIREDDDSFVWVQVQIVDEVGWIVIDAIEPVP